MAAWPSGAACASTFDDDSEVFARDLPCRFSRGRSANLKVNGTGKRAIDAVARAVFVAFAKSDRPRLSRE